MKHLVMSVVACYVAVFISATKFTDCGSDFAEINSLDVTDCPDDDAEEECTLKRGSRISINVNFTSHGNCDSLKTKVYGIIQGATLPFFLKQTDACKTGVSCPVVQGQEYTYYNDVNILRAFPEMSGIIVKWKLINERKENVLCAHVPSRIQ